MITSRKLENGLLFLHKEMPGSGIVDVRITLRSGALYDKANDVPPGTAHFLEHIVHEKTAKYESRQALTKQIELKGGSRNATTYTAEKMDFYATVLKEEAEVAADYVSQITAHAILTEEATEKHRSIITQECMSRMKDPNIKAWSAFKKAIYGGTGYEFRSLGTLESIAVISREDMQKIYDNRFKAEHSVLSIYGDIDVAHATALAEEYFLAMKSEDPHAAFAYESIPAAEERGKDLTKKFEFVEIPEEQAVAFYGGAMSGRNDKAMFAISLLMQMLAGDFSSILYKILRDEKHLLYHVGFSTDRADTFGTFAFSMHIAPENIQQAIDAIRSEVAKAAAGDIADDQIELAKTRIRAREIFSHQTVQSVAENDATIALLYPDLKHPDEWLERMENVTKSEMVEAANYISKHLTVLAVCGKASAGDRSQYSF